MAIKRDNKPSAIVKINGQQIGVMRNVVVNEIYKLAKKSTTGCIPGKDHSFVLITDDKKKEEIRKQHPQLIAPLWQCQNCKRITASM